MGELIGVVERGGVYVPEADLWLDPRRAKGRAFVSHAHADHYAGHGEVLCSEGTGELVEARFRRKRGRVVVAKGWGERFPVAPGYVAALYPAGHIVGSAMLWLEREADGASFLYTGDFKLRAGLSAEVCEVPRAEVVVMETTFGLPRYRFPEAEAVWERVRGFVRESHADGVLPVLMAYSLGKAQEVLCALEGNGWDVVVHRAVGEMTAVCAGLRPGVVWPGYRVIGKGGVGVGKRVLVVPPGGKVEGCSGARGSGVAAGDGDGLGVGPECEVPAMGWTRFSRSATTGILTSCWRLWRRWCRSGCIRCTGMPGSSRRRCVSEGWRRGRWEGPTSWSSGWVRRCVPPGRLSRGGFCRCLTGLGCRSTCSGTSGRGWRGGRWSRPSRGGTICGL